MWSYKPQPYDAGESESGVCQAGGAHTWKFGKCSKCHMNEGYGKRGVSGGNLNKEKKMKCVTCGFSWLDKYRKNECPKCLTELSGDKRQKPKPWDALESRSGECPKAKGGPHNWKFGKCRLCGINEGYGKHGLNGGVTNPEMKRTCPTCDFCWMDHYRKNECPKCLAKLDTHPRRQPGEVSTFKHKPGDALQSYSGVCPKGGLHAWKFGRCSNCGIGQGFASHSFKAYGEYV